MNKVVLLGRLTKDPDVKYTQTGKVVTQFTLAVDRPFKDADGNKETDFIPVAVWGKAAELVGNSCQKGHRLPTIFEMGFAGWDVPAIAQKLNVSKNTLYSYIGRYRG